MGRGRRPNLALEPTRALQTQRAFRQRKAQHLATLEEKVQLLSDENAKLRSLLHLETQSAHPPSHLVQSASKTSASPPAPSASLKRQAASSSSDDSTRQASRDPCESCLGLQQANRQLVLAATQVDAQVIELQHSVKTLRSVLMHHGIPFPSTTAMTDSQHPITVSPPAPTHRSKRICANDQELLPSGIHMTNSYFHPSTGAQHFVAPSSRPPPPPSATAGMASASTWHTPSPQAFLPAPTPPSAGFSPRASYSTYHSPDDSHASATAEEAYYRRPPPPAVARYASGTSTEALTPGSSKAHLPPPSHRGMSPARQHAHVASHWSNGVGTTSSASNSPATIARSHALPSSTSTTPYHCSPNSSALSTPADQGSFARSIGRRHADDYVSAGASSPGQLYAYAYDAAGIGISSPRIRIGQSSRDRNSPRSTAYSGAPASANTSQACRPSSTTPTTATADKKSYCPPITTTSNCNTITAHSDASPSLGSNSTTTSSVDTVALPTATQASASASASATHQAADNLKLDSLKQDECCFGLVNCDVF